MDEKTQKEVDPYKYYGERRTEQFIDEAIRTIQHKILYPYRRRWFRNRTQLKM